MAKNRNAVRAGIFMVLSVAGAIAIVIAIAGGSQFALSYHTHRVAFSLANNIGGLRKGDDVRLGGLRVGTVEGLEFEKKDSQAPGEPAADSIVVEFKMPSDYILAKNAKVGIEASLTGVTDLNVSDLGTGDEMPGDVALAGEPDAFTTLRASLAQMGPKINADLDKVNVTLDTYNQAGADVRTRVKQLVDSAVRALDSIHGWFGPSTDDFHQSVANIRDITGGLKEKLPRLEMSAQQLLNSLNVTVDKAQGAVADVRETAANAKEITATARSVIVRNQGHVDEIILGIKKASDDLKAAIAELRASPWRLFHTPTPDEMANLNLYDAARQFADGANDLSDAAISLRDALKDQHGDPQKVQKLYENLQQKFTKFQQTEDGLWQKVRE